MIPTGRGTSPSTAGVTRAGLVDYCPPLAVTAPLPGTRGHRAATSVRGGSARRLTPAPTGLHFGPGGGTPRGRRLTAPVGGARRREGVSLTEPPPFGGPGPHRPSEFRPLGRTVPPDPGSHRYLVRRVTAVTIAILARVRLAKEVRRMISRNGCTIVLTRSGLAPRPTSSTHGRENRQVTTRPPQHSVETEGFVAVAHGSRARAHTRPRGSPGWGVHPFAVGYPYHHWQREAPSRVGGRRTGGVPATRAAPRGLWPRWDGGSPSPVTGAARSDR